MKFMCQITTLASIAVLPTAGAIVFANPAESATLNRNPDTGFVESISGLEVNFTSLEGGKVEFFDVEFLPEGSFFDNQASLQTFIDQRARAKVAANSLAAALGSEEVTRVILGSFLSDSFFLPFSFDSDAVLFFEDGLIRPDQDSVFDSILEPTQSIAFNFNGPWAAFSAATPPTPIPSVPEPSLLFGGIVFIGAAALGKRRLVHTDQT